MPRLAPVTNTVLLAMFMTFSFLLDFVGYTALLLRAPLTGARALWPHRCTVGAASHQAGSIEIRPVRFVVPDPPLVRRGLGVALRRVLPLLLAPERSQVEVAPRAPQ